MDRPSGVCKEGIQDVLNERIHPFDDLTGMRPMILMICGSFDQDEIFHYDDLSSVARWQRGLQGLDDDPHWRIHSLLSHADRAQR